MAKITVTAGGRRFKSKKALHAYKRAYFAIAARGTLVPPDVVRAWLGPLIRAHPQPDHQIDLLKWAGSVRVDPWDATAGPYLVNFDGTESQISLNTCIERLKPTNMQIANGRSLLKWAGSVRVDPWDATAGPYLVNFDGTESQISLNTCIERLKPTNMQIANGHFLYGGGFKDTARMFLLCASRMPRLPPEITRRILARAALADVAYVGDAESAFKVLYGDGTRRLPWERS